MSIVRIGLSETKHFAEGYDAIFGTKKKGGDAKIICVPAHDPVFEDTSDLSQLRQPLLDEIEHFF